MSPEQAFRLVWLGLALCLLGGALADLKPIVGNFDRRPDPPTSEVRPSQEETPDPQAAERQPAEIILP
jgi:hypothetical protein